MGRAERLNPFNRWKAENGIAIQAMLLDRWGRQVKEGDIVMMNATGQTAWQIQEIKPLLRPDVPPGTIMVSCSAVFSTPVQGGMPLNDLMKVRDVSELRRTEDPPDRETEGDPPTGEPSTPPNDETPQEPPAEPSRIILP